MSPLHKNILKFITFICLWILVVIIAIKILNNNGRSYYYESIFRRQLERQLDEEKLDLDFRVKAPEGLEWLREVNRELYNVPFEFWMHRVERKKMENATCAPEYPYLYRLNFHNTYWQTYENENITFQLYNAYYDKRTSLPDGPVVRILAMLNQKEKIEFPKSFCQLWFDGEVDPTLVPVLEYHPIYPSYWGMFSGYWYPYLITCSPIHSLDGRVPQTLSLVQTQCETARNNLRISFEEPEEKQSFAVCVKGLNYPYSDNSARLIEWLELLRILGADKVFIYTMALHSNVSKVLDYYQKTDFVDLRPISLAGGEPNLPHFQYQILTADQMNKRLNEYIPYNDCFYRNMYKYKYVAALDIDEVIMPMEKLTKWQELINKAKEIQLSRGSKCPNGFSSICFLNTYFPQRVNYQNLSIPFDIPEYMYMMHHVNRTSRHSNYNDATKCFHNTDEVLTLHNHYSLTWLKSCSPITLDKDVGQLHHYRDPDLDDDNINGDFLIDANIWRYQNKLVGRTNEKLKQLKFLRT